MVSCAHSHDLAVAQGGGRLPSPHLLCRVRKHSSNFHTREPFYPRCVLAKVQHIISLPYQIVSLALLARLPCRFVGKPPHHLSPGRIMKVTGSANPHSRMIIRASSAHCTPSYSFAPSPSFASFHLSATSSLSSSQVHPGDTYIYIALHSQDLHNLDSCALR